MAGLGAKVLCAGCGEVRARVRFMAQVNLIERRLPECLGARSGGDTEILPPIMWAMESTRGMQVTKWERGGRTAGHSKAFRERELRMILISRSCCITRFAAFMRLE